MQNVILPIAMWAAIGLGALSLLAMGIAGLRSVWYGKVKPLKIAVVVLPVILLVVFIGTLQTPAQAGIYTLVIMFGLVLLGLLGTGLKQLYMSAAG